jgi:uncharacterized surface protein with fasciclin (FAS1) repeats
MEGITMESTKTLSFVTIFIVASLFIAGCSSDSSNPITPEFETTSANNLINLYTGTGSTASESAMYQRNINRLIVNIARSGYYAVEYFVNGNYPFYLAFQAMGPAEIYIQLRPGDYLSKVVLWDAQISSDFELTKVGGAEVYFVATEAISSIPNGIIPSNPRTLLADIVDTAISAGSFNTLVAAVQAAGLESTLRSAGPFTVFAPTDDAFAKLPAGTVEDLLKPENLQTLQNILLYHVAAEELKAVDVVGRPSIQMVQGQSTSISASGGKVMIDNAEIIITDIMATNGVIHVIDAVLIP